MEKANDPAYSKHILESIANIEAFIAGMGFDDFARDLKTQRAVTRELEIIGEAAKRLSEEFKKARPQIPWREVTDMRNFLIHDYLAVDPQEVWNAGTKGVKELKLSLQV